MVLALSFLAFVASGSLAVASLSANSFAFFAAAWTLAVISGSYTFRALRQPTDAVGWETLQPTGQYGQLAMVIGLLGFALGVVALAPFGG